MSRPGPDMDEGPIRAFIRGDTRGQWLVLTDQDDLDDAQRMKRWIKTTTPVEVRR